MSYQDMAESLGIEVNLAKVRVLRAKQLLADLLKTKP
jgi:DNA-directed RNA polymerase specialized sigma24 family protein